MYEGNRAGPFLKWGISGLCAGAFIGAIVSVIRAPGFPENPNVQVAKTGGALGAMFGLIAGVLIVLTMIVIDRNKREIIKRSAAEHYESKVVPELVQDIIDGQDHEAWHAVGLLLDYRDRQITKDTLASIEKRLKNPEVFTADPGAIVRHAVKSIIRTNCLESIEELMPYSRDWQTKLGVEVRRLKKDLKEIDKIVAKKS